MRSDQLSEPMVCFVTPSRELHVQCLEPVINWAESNWKLWLLVLFLLMLFCKILVNVQLIWRRACASKGDRLENRVGGAAWSCMGAHSNKHSNDQQKKCVNCSRLFSKTQDT